MEKSIMHDMFTDESNAYIKLDDLLSYIENKSLCEKIDCLCNLLEISESKNKETVKNIKEYEEFLKKRNFSKCEKRKVVEVKKTVPFYKKNVSNYKVSSDIKSFVSLDFFDFAKKIDSEDIDCDEVMLSIIEEITYYQAFADEAFISKDMDMVKDIKEIVLKLQEKLNYVKDSIKIKNIDSNDNLCNIVFLETSSGRSCFLEDIKGLEDYYFSFKKLYNYLRLGNPYDVRYFASIDKNLEGLAETRDVSGKTRIFFKRLNDNTYMIIGGIVKKSDRTTGYKNNIENRYSNYLKQESIILNSLNDPEYLERQKQYNDEVYNKFNPTDKALNKKGF